MFKRFSLKPQILKNIFIGYIILLFIFLYISILHAYLSRTFTYFRVWPGRNENRNKRLNSICLPIQINLLGNTQGTATLGTICSREHVFRQQIRNTCCCRIYSTCEGKWCFLFVYKTDTYCISEWYDKFLYLTDLLIVIVMNKVCAKQEHWCLCSLTILVTTSTYV